MKLAIELPSAQADKLRAEAQRLGLSVEELARAVLTDLLSTPDTAFQDVARPSSRTWSETKTDPNQ